MAFTSFVCFLVVFLFVQANGRNNSTCPKTFSCGNLTDLSFPFSLSTQPECGLMSMSDYDAKSYPRIQLLPGGDEYHAFAEPFNYTVGLWDPKLETVLRQHKCQAFNKNFSLPSSPSISFNTLTLYDFFKCNSTTNNTTKISEKYDHVAGYRMYNCCKGFSVYYKLREHAGSLPANCSLIRLPFISYSGDVFKMLSPGFLVDWKLSDECNQCHYGGGQCQTDKTNKFHCNKGQHSINQNVQTLAEKTRSKLHLILVAVLVILAYVVRQDC